MVFANLAGYPETICLALACRYCWTVGCRWVARRLPAVHAPWAGDRIVALGDGLWNRYLYGRPRRFVPRKGMKNKYGAPLSEDEAPEIESEAEASESDEATSHDNDDGEGEEVPNESEEEEASGGESDSDDSNAMLSDSESEAVDDEDDDDDEYTINLGYAIRGFPAGFRVLQARGHREFPVPSALQSQLTCYERQKFLPLVVRPGVPSDYYGVSLFPDGGDWVLRNLTAKQYVRERLLARELPYAVAGRPAGLGEALAIRIIWSDNEDISIYHGFAAMHRGRWAGHRFDVTTLDHVVAATQRGEGWRDVSTQVVMEISSVLKANPDI